MLLQACDRREIPFRAAAGLGPSAGEGQDGRPPAQRGLGRRGTERGAAGPTWRCETGQMYISCSPPCRFIGTRGGSTRDNQALPKMCPGHPSTSAPRSQTLQGWHSPAALAAPARGIPHLGYHRLPSGTTVCPRASLQRHGPERVPEHRSPASPHPAAAHHGHEERSDAPGLPSAQGCSLGVLPAPWAGFAPAAPHASTLSCSLGNYWARAGPVTLATGKCESGSPSASHPPSRPHTRLRC